MHDESVTLAHVHSNDVAYSWHHSIVELIGWDLIHHGYLLRGDRIAMRYGTGGIVAARNEVAKQFLAGDTDWLMWVDTDMGFPPDIVDRLMDTAHPTQRPIVGALCFAQRERVADGMGGYRCTAAPTIFDWVSRDGTTGFLGRASYPVNTLVRCAGTGSAAILIHRSVFERIGDSGWYDRVTDPMSGSEIGEDLSLCLRAGALDIPIHVHTGIRTSHFKEFWLAEQDFWMRAVAPPATERAAVIVPVLRRPQHAEPFMSSLRASTGLATVYAIADHDDADTIAAWRTAGADVLSSNAHTFAEKVNLGYRETDEPWIFITGDDVRFAAAWLDHAQAVAGNRFHVIGTNDLGNPRVTSGEHATHLLIRRSYVDDTGASWDGPKAVAHEGYRHWYVDDEIVTAAKQRGAWAMALGSIVEHLHPAWGKGETDEVYELGQSTAEQDRGLFLSRLEANA